MVYKNSKGELKITTRKRAKAWQEYGTVAKEIKPAATALRDDEDLEILLTKRKRPKSQSQPELLESLEAAANPKERRMARHRKKFDPLAELMKEFGPAKRRKVKRGSPKSARRTYNQQLGPYGARAAIPVNRRNPRKKRKTTEWNLIFGEIARRAAEIQLERGCPYRTAWDEAREEVAPGYVAKSAKANPRHRRGGRRGPQTREDEFRRPKRRGPGRKSRTLEL